MAAHFGPWSGRKYLLNKMTLARAMVAYFTHHSILTYLALIALGLVARDRLGRTPGRPCSRPW